jgi:hypothetical protein
VGAPWQDGSAARPGPRASSRSCPEGSTRSERRPATAVGAAGLLGHATASGRARYLRDSARSEDRAGRHGEARADPLPRPQRFRPERRCARAARTDRLSLRRPRARGAARTLATRMSRSPAPAPSRRPQAGPRRRAARPGPARHRPGRGSTPRDGRVAALRPLGGTIAGGVVAVLQAGRLRAGGSAPLRPGAAGGHCRGTRFQAGPGATGG